MDTATGSDVTITGARLIGLQGRDTGASWGDDVHEQESRQTLLVLETGDGLVGYGAAYTSLGLAAASMELLAPWLIGTSVDEPERRTEQLHQRAYWQGRGGALTTVISAVNIALWDLWGKVRGQPIGVLMGGRYRDRVRPYASLPFGTPEHTRDVVTAAREKGYLDVKLGWQPFGWDSATTDETLVRVARDAVGDGRLMIDAGASAAFWPHQHAWARRTARLLADHDVYWFEEPLDPDDLEGYRSLREHSPVRIATGEVLTRRQSYRRLIADRCLDVVQPDTTKVGGLSEARRIGWASHDAGLEYVPHGWNNVVGLAADLQLASALPHCRQIEYIDSGDYMTELLDGAMSLEPDGLLAIPAGPGLGITLDTDALARFPQTTL